MGTKTDTTKKLRFDDFGHRWGVVAGDADPHVRLKSLQDAPRYRARAYFLSRVAALAPDVLRTLWAIDVRTRRRHPDILRHWADVDRAALTAWATHWHLAPWVLAYARETLRLWRTWPGGRGRVWSSNPADVSGSLIPSTGRPAKRPAAMLVPARHFDWLVRAHVLGQPIEDVAIDESGQSVYSSTVRRALRSLAIILDEKTPTKPRR